jgi:septum site-determining protein MinC
MNDLAAAIRIKGIRDGLLVSLPAAGWEDQRTALLAQIDGQQAFFNGARLALEVGAQVIKVNEMVELRDQLSERNVSLWAVISDSAATEQTSQLLGLATRISKPRPEEVANLDAEPIPEETALFLNRTLRSGTRIEFPGTVVVLGDINPGAELVAQGNIVIWGRLRGTVHAGCAGNKEAVVCALDLLPMRLEIAGEVLRLPAGWEAGKPEVALLRDGTVVLEHWQTGGMGQV